MGVLGCGLHCLDKPQVGKLLYLPTGEPHSVKGIENASLLLTILLPGVEVAAKWLGFTDQAPSPASAA